MTSYGKCSRKRGSEGCHEIDSMGAQTLTDLWVWEHLQFEVCMNNLTVDLGSIAGNLSFWHFSNVSYDLMVSLKKHVCSSPGSLTYLSGYLYLAYFPIICPASFSSSSGRASRCSRAVSELLTGLVVSSWLDMVVTKMSGGCWVK